LACIRFFEVYIIGLLRYDATRHAALFYFPGLIGGGAVVLIIRGHGFVEDVPRFCGKEIAGKQNECDNKIKCPHKINKLRIKY
jgi:hypothetical protein